MSQISQIDECDKIDQKNIEKAKKAVLRLLDYARHHLRPLPGDPYSFIVAGFDPDCVEIVSNLIPDFYEEFSEKIKSCIQVYEFNNDHPGYVSKGDVMISYRKGPPEMPSLEFFSTGKTIIIYRRALDEVSTANK